MTDLELLNEYARSGSREALGEVVRRQVGWVSGVARRRVGDAGLAEDVTQAVFLVLAQKPPRLREDRALAGWLFAVVNNACNRALRGEMRRKKREKAFAMQHPEAGDSSDCMSAAEWAELSPHLDEAVQSMNNEDRQAILLRFYQQKSHAEVAAALGVSEEAARKRVQRAVSRLRQILGQRGVRAPGAAVLAVGLLAHTVPQASAAVVQSALAVTQGVAASAQVLWIAKGAMIMLTTKKIAAITGVCLMALLLGGGAAVMMLQSRHAPPPVVATTAPATQQTGEVFIGGDIPRSGVYSFRPGGLSLRQLLLAAGGVDPAKGERYLELSRKGDDGRHYSPFNNLAASDLLSPNGQDVPLEPSDQVVVLKAKPTTAPATAGWRTRFDRVYSLKDGELLKVIPAPYIAERMTYYTEFDGMQARNNPRWPDVMAFDWVDGQLQQWGSSFRGNTLTPVSDILGFVLRFNSYDVEAPADFDRFAIGGDWIVRKEATPDARLYALATIVRQLGGPALRFEQQMLTRKSIVVNGTYTYHPVNAESPFPTDTIHFYTDDTELSGPFGGGGTGTLRELLQRMGSFANLPVIDQRTDQPGPRISYADHRTSRLKIMPPGAGRDETISTILKHIAAQTGLELTIEDRPFPVWVGLPEAGL